MPVRKKLVSLDAELPQNLAQHAGQEFAIFPGEIYSPDKPANLFFNRAS